MKILFHNVASKPDGCTIIAVFEVKKEIPVEAEMWTYVAYYAGDVSALKWFEEAMPRVASVSVEYWQEHISAGL
jgi:hypothetical protein